MNAYEKENLYNRYVQQQAESAFENGLLSDVSFGNIKEHHPYKLYTPNYFIRIGLALLSAVAILFFSVLVGLMTSISSDGGFTVLLILLAIICYVLLEVFVSSNKYYNAGIDNVLMTSVVIFMIIAFNINNYPAQLPVTSLFVAVLCFWLAARFTDSFMSVLCFAAIVSFCFYTCTNAGSIGKTTVPFVIMFVSAASFTVVAKLLLNQSLVLYQRCFKSTKLLTLISFYASSNYFVVRELGSLIFERQLQPVESIPFGWFFWLCTFIIPPSYVLYGVVKKESMFIRTGFLSAVISVLTFRYYYAIIPASTAMILFGALLIGGSYLLIKYLRITRRGFTSLNIYKTAKSIPNVEAIIIAQAFGSKSVHHHEGFEFGGGSSGGAGATGSYE